MNIKELLSKSLASIAVPLMHVREIVIYSCLAIFSTVVHGKPCVFYKNCNNSYCVLYAEACKLT